VTCIVVVVASASAVLLRLCAEAVVCCGVSAAAVCNGGGSGGRIGVRASVFTFNGTQQACGGAGVSTPGGPGTIYRAVGEVVENRTRSLLVNNCGAGDHTTPAVLGDIGRQQYVLDVVTLASKGSLSVRKPSAVASDRGVVTILQLRGDASGRLNMIDGTDLILANVSTSDVDIAPTVSVSTVADPFSATSVVARTFYTKSLLLNAAGVTVAAGATVVFPPSVVVRDVPISIAGGVFGVQNLVLDTTSSLSLSSTGYSEGFTAGAYNLTSLRLLQSSQLTLTTVAALFVTNNFDVLDTSRLTITSAVKMRIVAGAFDLASSQVVAYTGVWSLEATTSLFIRSGAVIDGNGLGHGSSQFPSGCTLGPAASVSL
jgi:hypothetical protein